MDLLRRSFFYFFGTYLDQNQGFLVIRDNERDTYMNHTTRMANFDAARYLCQWARLARAIGGDMSNIEPVAPKTSSRFVSFEKSHKREQGLLLYRDATSGLHFQLPLVSSGHEKPSDSLAFQHCPGVFDWPVGKYIPVMLPELTFGEHVVVPSFYGKRITTGLGLRNSYYFRYEQPELITVDEKKVPNLGACKVSWSLSGKKIVSEFMVKIQLQIDAMRYVLAIAVPHTSHRTAASFCLGKDNHRAVIEKDDFQAEWALEDVSDNPDYKTYTGKINYLQVLSRKHPLVMRPGQQYRLQVAFDPDLSICG